MESNRKRRTPAAKLTYWREQVVKTPVLCRIAPHPTPRNPRRLFALPIVLCHNCHYKFKSTNSVFCLQNQREHGDISPRPDLADPPAKRAFPRTAPFLGERGSGEPNPGRAREKPQGGGAPRESGGQGKDAAGGKK